MQPYNTPEQNRKLIEDYPFLMPRDWRTGEPRADYDYKYTILDMLPDGWRNAFCPQMLDELKAILIKADYLDRYRISDIKEKYDIFSKNCIEGLYHVLQRTPAEKSTV